MIFLLARLILFLSIIETLQSRQTQPLLKYKVHEIPASKKYSTTETTIPIKFFSNSLYRKTSSVNGIQYAPLHASMQERKAKSGSDIKINPNMVTSTAYPTRSPRKKLYKNRYVEPRVSSARDQERRSDDQKMESYDHGLHSKESIKNSNVLFTVSRNLEPNVIYRTLQRIIPRYKPFKANYFKHYDVYKTPGAKDFTYEKQQNNIIKKIMTQKDEFNSGKTSQTVPSFIKVSDENIKYFKNRLHLNIARMYSTGKQQILPVYIDTQFLEFNKLPRKSQGFQPNTLSLTMFKTS